MRASTLLTALTAAGILTFGGSALAASWARGLLGAPFGGSDSRFYAIVIRGDGARLTADCTFDNSSRFGPIKGPVRLRGWRVRNGSLMPDVKLEVASNLEGPWRRVFTRSPRGKRETVVVSPGEEYSVTVDLSPFKQFLDAARWGRITLDKGDAERIDLHDLLPPPKA